MISADKIVEEFYSRRETMLLVIAKSREKMREMGFRVFILPKEDRHFHFGSVITGMFKSIRLDKSVVQHFDGAVPIGSFHVHRKQRGGLDYLSPMDKEYAISLGHRFMAIGFVYDKAYVKIFFFKKGAKATDEEYKLYSKVEMFGCRP